jgi:hypothetical protein
MTNAKTIAARRSKVRAARGFRGLFPCLYPWPSLSRGTPNKSGREKGTVPVLLRGLRKKGIVPAGFVRRTYLMNSIS